MVMIKNDFLIDFGDILFDIRRIVIVVCFTVCTITLLMILSGETDAYEIDKLFQRHESPYEETAYPHLRN